MEEPLGLGLSNDAFRLPGERREIGRHLDAGTDHVPTGLLFIDLRETLDVCRMKAWVGDRKHECSARLQHSGKEAEQLADFGHIHDGHRANGLVEWVRSSG